MRNRLDLLAFAVAVAASCAGELGRPLPAAAAVAPTSLAVACCQLDGITCCGKTGYAISSLACWEPK